jgi:hypothetical protein
VRTSALNLKILNFAILPLLLCFNYFANFLHMSTPTGLLKTENTEKLYTPDFPSWVWKHFYLSELAEFDGKAKCRVSGCVKPWVGRSGGTSNLAKHLSRHRISEPRDDKNKQNGGAELKQARLTAIGQPQFETALIRLIVTDCRPIGMVCTPAFKEFIKVYFVSLGDGLLSFQTLNPTYVVPSAQTLSAKLLAMDKQRSR